jgi:UDP-N-acetylglucosamine--N-acetylmuramyl-(pentapeptide) pyrophosphoryl-undecaprenol N-acetylglucosamine transferase
VTTGRAASTGGPAPGTWAVIAGGGTGGHLYPGVAVAMALMERGHDRAALRFVGARRGVEAKTKALEGFPVTLLPGRGLSRRLSARSVLANATATAGCLTATAVAISRFARWRPAVVICLGGYASLPCVVAAVVWRVPVVVVNVDAVPGAVNRWAARVAAVCAVGSPDVALPRAVVTGVPVRTDLASSRRRPAERREARRRLGLPEGAWVVAVSGGSLGSLRINQATLELARLWSGRADIAIRHVVGRRDWDAFRSADRPAGALVYLPVPYEEDMASLYAAADVAVQRAGANTVAELALAGVASVLVPLPGSPGDHQGANARAMAGAGAAVVVADAELDGARLAQQLEALLADPERLAAMGRAAGGLARPDAAAAVADLVEQSARRPRPGGTGPARKSDGAREAGVADVPGRGKESAGAA